MELKTSLWTATWLLAVSFVNFSFAGVQEGLDAYSKADYALALKEFSPLSDQVDVRAQFKVGVMYAYGQGVAKDETVALQWFRKAAEQGDAEARFNLGVAYAYGKGVAKDEPKAVEWYRKAAEQGNASAQYNLGSMYYQGHGVERDYAKAIVWYRKAAEQGIAFAQKNLGVMYYHGQGVPKNLAQAVAWYRKAAQQGDAQSQEAVNYLDGANTVTIASEASSYIAKYEMNDPESIVPAMKEKLVALEKKESEGRDLAVSNALSKAEADYREREAIAERERKSEQLLAPKRSSKTSGQSSEHNLASKRSSTTNGESSGCALVRNKAKRLACYDSVSTKNNPQKNYSTAQSSAECKSFERRSNDMADRLRVGMDMQEYQDALRDISAAYYACESTSSFEKNPNRNAYQRTISAYRLFVDLWRKGLAECREADREMRVATGGSYGIDMCKWENGPYGRHSDALSEAQQKYSLLSGYLEGRSYGGIAKSAIEKAAVYFSN